MKTATVMKMMSQEARRARKTARMSVDEMSKVCAAIAKNARSVADAHKKVEEWWKA